MIDGNMDDFNVDDHKRLRDIDDSTYGGPDFYDDSEVFNFYEGFFAQAPGQALLESVPRAHQEIHLQFLGELQSSEGLLYDSLDDDRRLVGFLRGYRAVEAYDSALTAGIVAAFAAPFLDVLGDHEIRPRTFFHAAMLKAIRTRTLDAAFQTSAVRLAIANFYSGHDMVRHQAVHGLKIPTHDEFRPMLLAACEVYSLADAALNPVTSQPLTLLDPEDYPHDDHRPSVISPSKRPQP